MSNQLIGQLRLDISKLRTDIEEINRLLARINQGRQNIDLGVNLGGIDRTIKEIDHMNQEGNLLYTTITKIKNGMLEISRRPAGGTETLVSQETLNSAKGFQGALNAIINSYKTLIPVQQQVPAVIDNTIRKLSELRAGYASDSAEFSKLTTHIKQLEAAKASSINQNLAATFKSDFNSIINGYNRLDAAQRKVPINIDVTIQKLTLLRNAYAIDSNEFSRITSQINRLETAKAKGLSTILSSEATRNERINNIFQNLLQQYRTEQISRDEFIRRASTFKNTALFGTLTDANQVKLVNELNGAISKNTAEKEKNARIRAVADYSSIQKQLDLYRQLSVEEQKIPANIKRIIVEYDKLIERYRLEGKEISKLIQERNQLNRQYTSSIASAQVNYQNTVKAAGVNTKTVTGMLTGTNTKGTEAEGTLGSGDARATIGNKMLNSAIYTSSAMMYGQSIMAAKNLVKANEEYENGLIDIQRTMNNITDKDMKDMGAEAINLGKKYGISVTEVQNAMTELARAGIDDKETLKQMTESVLLGVNTTEVKDSTEMVGYLVSTVKQLGLQFSDSNKIIDEWNYLADKYAVKSNDFAEAVQKAGASAKGVGIDLEELNAMVVVLGEKTQKTGNEMGTSFNALFTRIYRPETVKTLKEMGIEVDANNQTFNNFQQIIAQVDKKLEGMDEQSKDSVAILDALGGAWRKNDISIMARNWSQVEGLVTEQNKALGYSVNENNKVMGTYQKQIASLSVSFSELAVNIGQSGLFNEIKIIAGGIGSFVNVLNNLPAGSGQVILALANVAIGMKILAMATKGMTGIPIEQFLMKMGVQLKFLNGATMTAAWTTNGMVAGQKVLASATDAGTISIAQNVAITDALRVKRLATGLSTEAATVQEQAFAAALNATKGASVGASIAAGAMSLGITVLISAVVMGLMSLASASSEAAQKTKESIAEYDAMTGKVDSLTESFYKARFTVQDTATTKSEFIIIEKQLGEAFGDTTKAADLQNKTLKEQMGIIDELDQKKNNDFINENTRKAAESREYVNQRITTRIGTGGIGEKTLDTGNQNVFENGKYNAKKSNPLQQYADIFKKQGFTQEASAMGQEMTTEKSRVETYKALGTVLTELTGKYTEMTKSGTANGEQGKRLAEIIDNVKRSYGQLKGDIDDDIQLVEKFDSAVKSLDNSKSGKEFREKFSKEIDTIGEKINALSKLSPGDRTKAYDDVLAMKSAMQKTMTTDELEKFKPVMDEIFGSVSKGANEAADGITNLDSAMANQPDKQKALAATLKDTREGMTTFNKALYDVRNGTLLTGTEVEKMIALMPELANKVVETANGWKIEEGALQEVRNGYIATATSAIDTQNAMTEAAQKQLMNRIGIYENELNAMNQVVNAQSAMSTVLGAHNAYENTNLMPTEAVNAASASIGQYNEAKQQLLDIGQQRESLADIKKTIFSEGYGLSDKQLGTSEPKEKSSPSGSAEVSEPAGLIEKERYATLNMELEKTNTLIAQNKALQESIKNTDISERIRLLNIEIALEKKKQDGLHNIAEETRNERIELAETLKQSGIAFFGSGDSLEITNMKAVLDKKAAEVDAHRFDKNKDTHNKLKNEYDELKKGVERFIEIQTKSIPELSQQWWGLAKTVNDVNQSIISLKISLKFDDIDKANSIFETALSNLSHEEAMVGDDILKKQAIKSKTIDLYIQNIERNTTELNKLNQETDKATLMDQEYIDKKNALIKTIQEETETVKDQTKEMNDNKIEMVENTEQKIIDIIDKGVELKKKALDKELDDYKQYVSDLQDARDKANEESDYNKDMKKMGEERQKIQDQLNRLLLDNSLSGRQKRKELEDKLKDQDEKIADARVKRERDVTKQNLEEDVKIKEESNKKAQDNLDEEFDVEKKKLAAHKILMTQSFDSIKEKFPELFTALISNTDKFFGTFQSYEEKFGSVVSNVAENFQKNILPMIKGAVEQMKKITSDSKAAVDYSQVTFDPNHDYQAEKNQLKAAGVSDTNEVMVELEKKRAAKIYSSPELTAKYESTIPEQYRQTSTPKAEAVLTKATNVLTTAISQQEKVSKYTTIDKTIAKAKAKIGEYQNLWWATSDSGLKDSYHKGADQYRQIIKDLGGSISDSENFRDYKIPADMTFALGINNGLAKKTGMYMLHGSETMPEWILTNDQMHNFVKNMANNFSMNFPTSNKQISGDINLTIPIMGNADSSTVGKVEDAGRRILTDLKKELNKMGMYK